MAMGTIRYDSIRKGYIINWHGANERVTNVRDDGPSEYYEGERVISFDLEPADEEAVKLLGSFYSHGTYGGVGFLEVELVRIPSGWVNGKPCYTSEEFTYAKRGFGPIESDEELLAFAEKASHGWYNAGWHHTFTTYYLSDYALSEPRASLTRREFDRLKELQAAQIAAEKAADEARGWKLVETICWADNSVEEIWEDKNGERRSSMVTQPHGDAC